jgi:flagellar biosynthesis/type III secretory pathway M-ring protein FliF/YscJ
MNAERARSRTVPPKPAPTPSVAPDAAEPEDGETGRPAVVPSKSRLSEKVRDLVGRHPEETLSVLRRWMEEKFRGG